MADGEIVLIAATLGATIGFGASLITTYVSNRAANKRLLTQLYHDDQQQAIRHLYDIVSSKEKIVENWISPILRFLDSFDGALLPESLRKDIVKKTEDLRQHMKEHLPHLYTELSEEEAGEITQEYEQHLATLPPEEREEQLFFGHWEDVRREIQSELVGFGTGKAKS